MANNVRVKETTARERVVGNPQQKEYKEKGVIDSGCSRHMTRNKCYLTDYEDYNGGFVSFGDEAVITACYVLNRALVIKPHNKTPYELIHGKPPLIDFMKPFRCPVTILNTKNYLGKFDEKAYEGFFVGYSVEPKIILLQVKLKRRKQEYTLIHICTTDPLISQGPEDSAVDAGKKATKGNTQEEGLDYDEVFSPVARIEAIRLFLAYASFKDFIVYQMDVKSAFLYGKIKEETASTLMEPNKALVKDAKAKDTSHLHVVKRIFRYLKGQPKLAFGILEIHHLTWKRILIVIMLELALTGNPQHEVVNFLAKVKIGNSSLNTAGQRTSPRVPSDLDNWNAALLQPFDFTMHNFHGFFNEVEFIINVYFIRRNYQRLIG
nr:ribonuclease H-like domain-containing protein [Tanacetum cinerariifolium]